MLVVLEGRRGRRVPLELMGLPVRKVLLENQGRREQTVVTALMVPTVVTA
jgi:hypothetical protein